MFYFLVLVVVGGFGRGRAPLGPDPMSQFVVVLLRIADIMSWNAVSLSAGMSEALTWLALLMQLSKQYPRINQRGHILQVPSQSILFVTIL